MRRPGRRVVLQHKHLQCRPDSPRDRNDSAYAVKDLPISCAFSHCGGSSRSNPMCDAHPNNLNVSNMCPPFCIQSGDCREEPTIYVGSPRFCFSLKIREEPFALVKARPANPANCFGWVTAIPAQQLHNASKAMYAAAPNSERDSANLPRCAAKAHDAIGCRIVLLLRLIIVSSADSSFLSSTTKIDTAVLRESTCYEKIEITVSRKPSGVCAW
jgi:hypothetical protein